MKKIAIVIDSLTGGGAERVMISLANALIEQGHQVTLLSLSEYCDYSIPPTIDLHKLFTGKASKVDRVWRIKKSIHILEQWFVDIQSKKGNFDLILSNLDRSNNLLAECELKDDKRLFFIIHTSIEEEIIRQKKLGWFAYRYLVKTKARLSGKQLITVSEGLKKEVNEGSRITPLSVTTIYNPFNFNSISEQANIENADLPEQKYIIHVGRFARTKRHDVLLQAFKGVDSQYKLVLLCNKVKKAKKLAQKYDVSDRVICPGFQQNPYNWIKKAEVLVLSSDYEGLPTVLIEAIAVGTKVVSTNCPFGPDEILTGNLSPYLVPRRDPKALEQAINLAITASIESSQAEILAKVKGSHIAKEYLKLSS